MVAVLLVAGVGLPPAVGRTPRGPGTAHLSLDSAPSSSIGLEVERQGVTVVDPPFVDSTPG